MHSPKGKEHKTGWRRGQCPANEIFMMVIESNFIAIKAYVLGKKGSSVSHSIYGSAAPLTDPTSRIFLLSDFQ